MSNRSKTVLAVTAAVLVMLGIGMRFHEIARNDFIFYDEGMWLDQNRGFLKLVEQHPHRTLFEFFKILGISFHLSLHTAKALWAFIANLRVFFVGADGLYFTRLVSAISGSLTLWVTFLFSKRYFASSKIGLLSAVLLAVLPSHLFYSRIGLQESFSTLLFIGGMYLYLFPARMNWRTFVSGACFAGVFFSNYRMIVIPLLTLFSEVYRGCSLKTKINFRKYLWNTLVFLGLVFFIGNIDNGANTRVTFAWMFHQRHLAQGHFNFLNLLSYPYYTFALETILFGALFWSSLFLIFKRQWARLYPFALTCLFMFGFSLFQEKGTRYLCAAMPFMVMAVAGSIIYFYAHLEKRYLRYCVTALIAVMLMSQLFKDYRILRYVPAYRISMEDLTRMAPNVKVISTQPVVQGMYVRDRRQVVPPPGNVRSLIVLFRQGYRYLIVGPQAYVSYTADGHRFSPKLAGYLEFIEERVPPLNVYGHFEEDLLERFVLEHNEDLFRSLSFIRINRQEGFGKLRVYSIEHCLSVMAGALKASAAR